MDRVAVTVSTTTYVMIMHLLAMIAYFLIFYEVLPSESSIYITDLIYYSALAFTEDR